MTPDGARALRHGLQASHEAVAFGEATGNGTEVSRVLPPCVPRVVIANPPQVKAIAHAQVKTDTKPSSRS